MMCFVYIDSFGILIALRLLMTFFKLMKIECYDVADDFLSFTFCVALVNDKCRCCVVACY